MPPVGKFTAYFANVSCHSASKHAMCVSRLFVRLFRLFSPRCLASTPASLPSPFRAWVSAQGFAITEFARPSHHTESSSRIGSQSLVLCGLALCFQLLSTVGLRRRSFFPLQNPSTWVLTGTFTPLRCAPSQSHSIVPTGLNPLMIINPPLKRWASLVVSLRDH